MRGRQLIDGAAFGPDALKAIGEAFDAAWVEIAGNFGNVPADIDNARYRLANALLSVASEDSRDAEVLKRAALERIVLDYDRYSP
jgi:arginase family enzyme